MKKLFGTDGMRGEAGKFPLDAETVQTVGASLAQHLTVKLGHPPLIVIGRDTRESGGWIEQALIAGASQAGGETKSAGVITTPGVAFLARTMPADAGVVISASHNAYRDNGIKIFAPSGRKLDEATERLIESDVYAQSGKTAEALAATTQVEGSETLDLKSRYLEFLGSEIAHNLTLTGIRLTLDCANGAASELAPALFRGLGATVNVINNAPDGRNINLDCGSLHTEKLQAEVTKNEADLGVAFDGDADRALFVDARGKLVNGDGTLWVLARHLRAQQELNEDAVVATVMSNLGLELALKSEGIRLIRADVGDKYVLEELLRQDLSLGGEQSGHIIFPRLSLAGDGMITTLCLLRAITEAGKPLHELTKGFETFPQILVNVHVKNKQPFDEVPEIQKAAVEVERNLGSEGRLLLRYSGTESLARVMIEGKSQQEIDKLAASLASVIQKNLGA